jgi:hypothetical protein
VGGGAQSQAAVLLTPQGRPCHCQRRCRRRCCWPHLLPLLLAVGVVAVLRVGVTSLAWHHCLQYRHRHLPRLFLLLLLLLWRGEPQTSHLLLLLLFLLLLLLLLPLPRPPPPPALGSRDLLEGTPATARSELTQAQPLSLSPARAETAAPGWAAPWLRSPPGATAACCR